MTNPQTDAPLPHIVRFWRDAGPAKWFAKDDAFDAELRARFLDEHFANARREREAQLDDADGALALILLLDQVPRNVFRDSAHAFATDPLAREYAQRALDAGFDTCVDPELRIFFYMPFDFRSDGRPGPHGRADRSPRRCHLSQVCGSASRCDPALWAVSASQSGVGAGEYSGRAGLVGCGGWVLIG